MIEFQLSQTDPNVNPVDYVEFDSSVSCGLCAYLRVENNLYVCDAFPNGVPEPIIQGEASHRKPYPGDNGIQFKLRDFGV